MLFHIMQNYEWKAKAEKHATLVWKINQVQKYLLTIQLFWRKRGP